MAGGSACWDVAYMAGGGMHGWGVCVTGACLVGGCMAGEMATAAGGTHTTGMHSCLLGDLGTFSTKLMSDRVFETKENKLLT